MTDTNFAQAFDDLFAWCRQHNFSGHDPFDALNSKIFQVTPFKNSAAARLLWTQTVKRSPLNLRGVALVQLGKNSKGIALFSLAALATYRRTRTREAEAEARELLQQLISLRLETGPWHSVGLQFRLAIASVLRAAWHAHNCSHRVCRTGPRRSGRCVC